MKAQTNAANPLSIKEADQNQKAARKQELDDIRFVLSSVQGRRMLFRQLAVSGLHRSSMTGSVWTYFHEGERSIANRLLIDIEEADTEAYFQMVRENRKKENSNV